MSFEDELEYEKELAKRSEESKKNTFDSWITDLEDKEQPETCDIDSEDCENCGS